MDELDAIDRRIRWGLILGRHGRGSLERADADGAGGSTGSDGDLSAMDDALEFIYDREFAARSHRQGDQGGGTGLAVPVWLSGVRELFPRDAAEVLERDALYRYGLTELITDPTVLERAEPTTDLLKAIVQFKHLMGGDVITVARRKVAEVVEQIRAELETTAAPALYGPSRPLDAAPRRTFRNIDWHRTIRDNLRNWDAVGGHLVADRMRYRHRSHDRSPWDIIISVDQSGSMSDSLIHASVMAAIFAGLPAVSVSLVLWDHRIVDATEHVHEPLDVLMNVQLGGGTDMLPALQYCGGLVRDPDRTLLVMVSDFAVWGDKEPIVELASDLAGSGVRCIGLTALTSHGSPEYDVRFAGAFADRGWFVASLTPAALAEHVGRIVRG